MPDVCLVVPCFNEASRLPAAAFLEFLGQHPEVAFCFVNDGSTDTTESVLERLRQAAPDRVTVATLPENRGKGEAVRHGMRLAAGAKQFAFVGYWDADLATPLKELTAMHDVLAQSPVCQIVLGSRWRRLGSAIERNEVRHLLGRVFATAASWVLNQPVYDSQCGAKLVRASAVEPLFSEPFLTRWLFDVELLARLRTHSPWAQVHNAAVEMPLSEWHDVRDSRLGIGYMLMVPRDLWRIHRQYRIR